MALSDTQVRQLRAKLDGKHVKTRSANGADLHYVEGWHVIAEANRIFGYDAWDRRTLASHCVWSGARRAPITAQPTPPRCASASEREILPLCGRDQGRGRPRPLPRGKLTSLRSKAPRPTPPSGRLPPLATHSGLPFMTESRLACARRAVLRLLREIFADWPLGAALKHRQAYLKPRHRKVLRRSSAAGHERSSRHRASLRCVGAEYRDAAGSASLYQ